MESSHEKMTAAPRKININYHIFGTSRMMSKSWEEKKIKEMLDKDKK